MGPGGEGPTVGGFEVGGCEGEGLWGLAADEVDDGDVLALFAAVGPEELLAWETGDEEPMDTRLWFAAALRAGIASAQMAACPMQ